jgi:hypothetical protein
MEHTLEDVLKCGTLRDNVLRRSPMRDDQSNHITIFKRHVLEIGKKSSLDWFFGGQQPSAAQG